MPLEPNPLSEIKGARVLALFGDGITTDHISPAGGIAKDSPAAEYLLEHGVQPKDFNQYGTRRGNHQVMMRGTFANIRIKNLLMGSVEGGRTLHLPDGEEMTIYDAAMKYQQEGVPLVVIAGKEYGTGSSRDWAAKGTALLGVRAVIAESYERIHRSNLVGMGVLPLVFLQGQNADTLGLTGWETYEILGLSDQIAPHQRMSVVARRDEASMRRALSSHMLKKYNLQVDKADETTLLEGLKSEGLHLVRGTNLITGLPETVSVDRGELEIAAGQIVEFQVTARLDTPVDVEYYKNGGILQTVLRKLAR
jgi:aconitase A